MTGELPALSVCQLTLRESTFADDVHLCRTLGITGMGIDESKLGDDDETNARLMRDASVSASLCKPTLMTILPSAAFPGPDDPDDRVDLICQSIRRLARFDPASVVVLTGPEGRYDAETARQICVEGFRTVIDEAAKVEVTISTEPMRPEVRDLGTFINSLPEMFDLIDAVGPELGIVYDTWHIWDAKDTLPLTESHAGMFAGVQVSDYRMPTRNSHDRLLPGDGVINFPAIFGALDRGGFSGWYDLEVFSDLDLPDSLWCRPASDWLGDGRDKLLDLWSRRDT
jgi:sugar phosphate isomerase/epimerase